MYREKEKIPNGRGKGPGEDEGKQLKEVGVSSRQVKKVVTLWVATTTSSLHNKTRCRQFAPAGAKLRDTQFSLFTETITGGGVFFFCARNSPFVKSRGKK